MNFTNFNQNLARIFASNKDKKIAVAVSGGVDSMCLTMLLKEYCKQKGLNLTAITVDHKLRNESTLESKKVAKYLENQQVDHVILTWHHNDIKSNIQNNARDARYQLMTSYCKAHSIKYLFVAHTFDDQAETVMLRILRGSGIDGISGMELHTQIADVNIIRPLLGFTKSEILHFMKANSFTWFEDSSNSNLKFDRVKVRQLISEFQQDFQLTERLNLLSENAKRARNFFDKYIENFFKEYCKIGDLGFITIPKSKFFSEHEEVRYRLINYLIRYVKNEFNNYPIRLEKIKYISEKLLIHDKIKLTVSGCIIFLNKGNIFLYKEPKFIEHVKELSKGENIWDKRYKIFINREGYKIVNIDKSKWSKIKPKKFQHSFPGNIIYSSPLIFSKEKNVYVLPLSKIISSRKENNLRVVVTHILSKTNFEIIC